jgi:uncharacterized protein (UPF0276 family)
VEFSINYSIEAADLLRAGKIRVDRLKCADWPDMIASARELAPVYVHFPFDVGSRLGREADFQRAHELARQTDTRFINFHVVSYDRDFPELPRDSTDDHATRQFTNRLSSETERAADYFGRGHVIIENIPWFGAGGEFHRFSVDPEIISRAADDTDVGFLLDLSHARIAAHYLGLDARRYIEMMPVDRLRELHVTGVRMHKTRLADHMDLADEDWAFFDWALDRIRSGAWAKPWMVAFEYGGIGEPFKWRSRIDVIEQQTPRLYEAVHRV